MCRLLHRQLGLQTIEIAIDRGDGEHATVAPITHQAILGLDVALNCDRVPAFGMADIVDRHVIVLAPEKRHRVEALFVPEHVGGRGLALALGDNPVLDPDALAGMRIGPARDVAGGENSGRWFPDTR